MNAEEVAAKHAAAIMEVVKEILMMIVDVDRDGYCGFQAQM